MRKQDNIQAKSDQHQSKGSLKSNLSKCIRKIIIEFKMAKSNKDVQENIEKLQILEQKTQTLLMQKQNFQAQLIETENALNELETNKGSVYKIVGNIMILAEKDKLKEDLNNRNDVIMLRIKNIEKQENKLKEEATEIQDIVMSSLKKEEKQ